MTKIDYQKILHDEPFAVYLANRERYLTSHQLMDFVRCPRLYYLKKTGALTTDPNKVSAELILGSAAHKLILEGRQEFDRCYAVGAPINPKTGKEYGRDTQAFAKWEEEQRREKGASIEFITTDQWYVVSNMADAVAKHAEAQRLLKNGVAERVLRSDFDGIPVQSRLDWFTEIDGVPVIVDLKTCTDLDSFEYDARKFLYGVQFAFYQQILLHLTFDVLKTDVAVPAKVYAIAVEKKEPFRCGVFVVPDTVLELFGAKLFADIKSLRECQDAGEYPTLYETVRSLHL
ncbi:MAG: PD-(D/E)XK nuclease-like domain-containing protein [Planctomycetaceae bacterium]|nr:PD-(D/E)XK nuclease-like domain-containing protein [Planctomycetaceae bacterium]